MPIAEVETVDRWNALLDRVREWVPFYRERLPAGRLMSLEEVADLPFTTKDDFREQYPFGLFAAPADEVVRVHMSSGTTGKPVITGYTRSDLDLWSDCMRRVLEAGDVSSADVLQ